MAAFEAVCELPPLEARRAAGPRLVKGANEHYDIIEAVMAGDTVAAEQITRDHFMSVIAALRQLEELKTQRPGMAL